MKLSFRPHHFLCAIGFQGKGYSKPFIKNFAMIMEHLRAPNGDNAIITVTGDTDSICSPCPHKRDKLCETQEKITVLDHAHEKALDIKPDDTLTWGCCQTTDH